MHLSGREVAPTSQCPGTPTSAPHYLILSLLLPHHPQAPEKGVVLRPLPRLTAMVLRYPPPSTWCYQLDPQHVELWEGVGTFRFSCHWCAPLKWDCGPPYSTYPKLDMPTNVQSSRTNSSWAKLPNCNRIESLLLLSWSPQAFAAGSRLRHYWCLRSRYRLLLVT